ncbi:DUF3572 domain-containing protein [Allorhizobium undicola]|uniref:DUF3572 domain-containing protein n=1 Tax=Allorhizobium undicola TaxID=78527 RepID=UPI003D356ADB
MRDKSHDKRLSGEEAEKLAIAVLAWLAGEPDMMGRFLALTGVEPQQLRSAMTQPAFLGGLLDFLMQHEPSLLAFCAASDTKPESVMAAWAHYVKPGLDSGEY